MTGIQLKRGASEETLPALLPGEPAVLGKHLYVADASGAPLKLPTSDELAGKADKSTKLSKTITTTWLGKNIPVMQTMPVAGVTASSVVEVSLPTNATVSQVSAYQALNLQDGGQGKGFLVLRAFGEKNTEPIPIQLVIRGDL